MIYFILNIICNINIISKLCVAYLEILKLWNHCEYNYFNIHTKNSNYNQNIC